MGLVEGLGLRGEAERAEQRGRLRMRAIAMVCPFRDPDAAVLERTDEGADPYDA